MRLVETKKKRYGDNEVRVSDGVPNEPSFRALHLLKSLKIYVYQTKANTVYATTAKKKICLKQQKNLFFMPKHSGIPPLATQSV